MKNAIKAPHFSFEGQHIACAIVEGVTPSLWFDADDVAKVLRITDTYKTVCQLENGPDYFDSFYINGGPLYLTLAGLLNISAGRRSVISIRFSRWITDVVFPAYAAMIRPPMVEVKSKPVVDRVKSQPTAANELPPHLAGIISTNPEDVTAALRFMAQFLSIALRDNPVANASA